MAESGSDDVDSGTSNRKGSKQQEYHAHFVEPQQKDDLDAHDSKILVEPCGDDTLIVKLGFLQVKHVYEVRFSIQDQLGEDVSFDPVQNLHAKIESVTATENGEGHNLVVIFNAVREKIMKESITISSAVDPSKKVFLELHARVLGEGKGTPSLKKGIHCVRVDPSDVMTDDSDWQGF